jgi:hypothetical protein
MGTAGSAGYGQKQGRTVGLLWFDGLLLTKYLISGEILTCLCENQLQLGEMMEWFPDISGRQAVQSTRDSSQVTFPPKMMNSLVIEDSYDNSPVSKKVSNG